MLIQKKNDAIMPGDVVGFRVTTGEEIIGKLVQITNETATISKPIGVTMQMVDADKAGFVFTPFQAAAPDDGEFTFRLSSMLYNPTKVWPQLSTNYLSATTGLVLPQNKGLLA